MHNLELHGKKQSMVTKGKKQTEQKMKLSCLLGKMFPILTRCSFEIPACRPKNLHDTGTWDQA